MYPAELEIKDTTETITSVSYVDLLLSIWRDCQLHTSIYDKRDYFNIHITNFPFLSMNSPSSPAYGVFKFSAYTIRPDAPRMNVLFWGPGDFPVSYAKKGYLVERLKLSFSKFYGRYGDLIQQYEVSLSRMLNEILTLDQLQWLLNRSDFPPISWPWNPAWPSLNYEWFTLGICNGCGVTAGNAYPSGHLVPSPFLGLACAPIVETSFLEHAVSLLDFSPWIPLGTFSILLGTVLKISSDKV